MADLRGPWNETGDRLTELGRKLKLHYEQQHGGDGQESRQELADAARRVGSAVQDAFEALGAAARDAEVQADVRQVGQSLVDALGATLGQASDELRRTWSERKGDVAARRSSSSAPSPGPGSGAAAPGDAPSPGAPSGTTSGTTTEAPAEPTDTPPRDTPPTDGPRIEPWGTP